MKGYIIVHSIYVPFGHNHPCVKGYFLHNMKHERIKFTKKHERIREKNVNRMHNFYMDYAVYEFFSQVRYSVYNILF